MNGSLYFFSVSVSLGVDGLSSLGGGGTR